MPQPDDKRLAVIMGDEVADAIDNSIGAPMDGIIAIRQLIHELPDLHRRNRSRSRFRRFENALPIYRGLVAWCGIDFDYVEHRGQLHILSVRDGIAADTADAIIDQPAAPARYVDETDCGGGVSIIS